MARVHVSRGRGIIRGPERPLGLLEILTNTIEELNACISAAEAKFWQAMDDRETGGGTGGLDVQAIWRHFSVGRSLSMMISVAVERANALQFALK